jgi:NAD(P)H-quinone oxidoreductase subunit 5
MIALLASAAVPAAFAASAAFAFSTGRAAPARASRVAEFAAIAALAAAVGAAALLATGAGRVAAAAALLDAVSATMLVLIAFIGWVVLRYSATAMDRAPGQAAFTGWLSATLAAVTVLVQAGDLVLLVAAWIATSLFLHKLLLHHPDRPGAVRAARKKFVMARAGDAALIGAAAILALGYGTTTIADILTAARDGLRPEGVVWAAALLGVAALLKSAQFPTHGWLTEVMETPTPVSALLHAGVVNAGGFLLIRFADVMLLSPGALALLAIVGGFTALFAGLVMLTQPAVKTALAWSTIAQMGFMTLQCGLALFPLALLHIVAHSLYKAHAFLSAGGAVEAIAAQRRPGPVAIPSPAAVARAFGIALAVYAVAALAVGVAGKSPQSLALGGILVLGVAYLLAQGLADAAPRALSLRMAAYSAAAAAGYFSLQWAAERLTAGALPATPAPGPMEWALVVFAVASFGLVALAQAMLPLWARHPAAAGLRVHLANGFYVNALFDRAVGGWRLRPAAPHTAPHTALTTGDA